MPAIEQFLLSPSDGPYDIRVRWCDGLYEAASLFCKATYCVKISFAISSNALLTVASLVDTVSGFNLVHKDFLQPTWRKLIVSIKSPPVQTANC